MIYTGFAAKVAERGRCYSNVHLYNTETNIALCGYKPSKKMKWHWCAMYPYEDYIECKKCLAKLNEK